MTKDEGQGAFLGEGSHRVHGRCPLGPPWVGEASHGWRPGDRTGVTAQESLLRSKGLLQSQPWHSASFRSFSIPPGCRPREGHPGEMFLGVQRDFCLCQNTRRFLAVC